jgi:hypothetical protein
MIRQENPLFDFASQMIPEQSKNKDQTRKKLIERLGQGITVELSDHRTVAFELQDAPLLSYDMKTEDHRNVSVLVTSRRKQVASVATLVYANSPQEGRELSKYYDDDVSPDLKGRGLITAATALLFQVLRGKDVNKVWGKIEGGIDNLASIKARLMTPDLINGGFFATEPRVVSLGGGAYELYLVTHLKQNVQTVSFDTFMEELRQAISRLQ